MPLLLLCDAVLVDDKSNLDALSACILSRGGDVVDDIEDGDDRADDCKASGWKCREKSCQEVVRMNGK